MKKSISPNQISPELVGPSKNLDDGPTQFRGLALHGFIGLGVWMTVGLLFEGLLGYKTPAYLGDSQRRELLRLAHSHGTLLSVVMLVAAKKGIPLPSLAAFMLRVGGTLMPLGFLAAGLYHAEGDPGPGIFGVPLGALLVICATAMIALSLWRRPA